MTPREQLEQLRALKAARENAGTGFKRKLDAARVASPGQAFAGSATRRFADNFLSIPEGVGNLLAGGAAVADTAVGSIPRLFTDEPLNLGERFSTEFKEQKGQFPASLLRAIPTPSANQVRAGAQTATDSIGGLLGSEPLILPVVRKNFESKLDEIEQRQAEIARKRPIATALGEVGGDVATLLTGRAPLVRGTARKPPKFDAASTRKIDQIANLKSVRALIRGTGRAVETGTEAAVLAALQDGNPVESAAFAGGLQLAGSATLQVTKGIFRNPGRVALAAIVAHQIGKSLTPGGEDRILPTIEDSFDEVSLGMVAGIVTGAAGLGRLRGTTASKLFPEAIDALATIPRGATISLINDIIADESNTLPVLNQYLEDPGFFGKDESRIQKAIEDSDISLSATIAELIDRGDGFAQKIDQIGTETAKAISQTKFRSALAADNDGVTAARPSAIAKSAARVLGNDRVKRLGFEARDTGPVKFIANVLRDGPAVETLGGRLPKSQFETFLAAGLDDLIFRSTETIEGQRIISSKKLRNHWESLPESSKDFYTERKTIEAFIDAAGTQKLSGLSASISEALMNGEELPKLLGIKEAKKNE